MVWLVGLVFMIWLCGECILVSFGEIDIFVFCLYCLFGGYCLCCGIVVYWFCSGDCLEYFLLFCSYFYVVVFRYLVMMLVVILIVGYGWLVDGSCICCSGIMCCLVSVLDCFYWLSWLMCNVGRWLWVWWCVVCFLIDWIWFWMCEW